MPRDLVDVLDYLLPTATEAATPASATPAPRELRRRRDSQPAALPIVAMPIGDRDLVRAAFAFNLAVEISRLGGSVTLIGPRDERATPLWPSADRGPIGAELDWVEANDLGALNRAALDVAVSRAPEATDGGLVLVRVPPDWMRDYADGRALLRWVLLFASPDGRDLQEAYALAKRLWRAGAATRVGVTIHGARRLSDAEAAFGRLASTARRHLRHNVVSYGLLVDDLHVYRAIVARRPIGLEHPQSRAARALRDVARLLLQDARDHSVG